MDDIQIKKYNPHTIYTIGHSTRRIDDFVSLLIKNEVELLVDVRSFPGSRRYPQFNKGNLALSLPAVGIEYVHIENLGGRRTALKESKNTSWHNASFRGYADYMESASFKEAIAQLMNLATINLTCIMCAEAVWWRCHRSMIADYLKSIGWQVLHILSEYKTQAHSYTSPAKIINSHLVYGAPHDLFNQ